MTPLLPGAAPREAPSSARPVQSFPEVSMGARRIALVLATGEVVDAVIVAEGEIVSLARKEPRALPLHAGELAAWYSQVELQRTLDGQSADAQGTLG
jgi:hypothetical protein